MSVYRITDNKSGKTIRIEGDSPPTEDELGQIFESVGIEKPKETSGLASTLSGLAAETSQAITEREPKPTGGFLSRLANATKDTMTAPFSFGGMKRLFDPRIGKTGLSQMAQQEGEKVQDAVSSVSPLTGAILPPLTPRAAAEQVGGEAVLPAVGAVASKVVGPVGGTLAKVGQFLSGKRASDYARLVKDPAAILPEVLGGSKSVAKAGEQLGEAMKGAGLRKPLTPFSDYGPKVEAAWTKATKDIPESLLEDPAVIKEAVKNLEPQEAFSTYRAISKIMKSAVEGKDKELFRSQTIFKKALQDYMGELSGEYGKASKEFARASLGKSFLDILPTTKYGVPSIGRAGFASMLAIPKAAAIPLTSPLVHGVVTAGVGAAKRIAESPTGQRIGLQALLQKARERKTKP